MVVKVRSFGLYSYLYDIRSKWSYCNLPCTQGVEALTNQQVKSRLHFFYMPHQSFTIKPHRRAIDARESLWQKKCVLIEVFLWGMMTEIYAQNVALFSHLINHLPQLRYHLLRLTNPQHLVQIGRNMSMNVE